MRGPWHSESAAVFFGSATLVGVALAYLLLYLFP